MSSSMSPPMETAAHHGFSPATVLRPGEPFSMGELGALTRDGVVVPVLADAHILAGTTLTHTVKLTVLQRILPGNLRLRGVLGRLGAAWFYSCAPAPGLIPVLVDKSARTTSTVPPGFSLHQTVFRSDHLMDFHGLRITTPLRTCMDLALHVNGSDADQALMLLMASPHGECSPAQVHKAFEGLGRTPGRHTAMARIRILDRAMARATNL